MFVYREEEEDVGGDDRLLHFQVEGRIQFDETSSRDLYLVPAKRYSRARDARLHSLTNPTME